MKKKSSIIKLSLVGFFLIIGLIATFCSFEFGLGKYNSTMSTIKLGLDLKGGVYAVYEATDESDENLSSRMDGTRSRLQTLIVDKGYSEATVVREGSNRLRVEVPDVDEPDKIFTIIGKPAEISFVLDSTSETVITGEHITSATAGYDNTGAAIVQLKLNSIGRTRFGDATSNNIGSTMSIKVTVAGEETKTLASPKIESAITNGEALISGVGTYEEAKNLADQIMSGTFEVTLRLIESSTVSATLGEQALFYALIAGGIAILLVMIIMCLVYRMFGVISSVVLLIYIVLMMFLLALFPNVQLTLPGIAGIILTLGMAVDGNVIIFERIKDEYRNGKSIMASTYAGFKKSFWTIFDSNITTAIAGVLLLVLGTGAIKGFGTTLLIGIILSMFTSLVVTRFLSRWLIGINSTNPKLYNLKRGSKYQGLGGDQTEESVQKQIDEELAEKRAEEEEKRKEREEAKRLKGEVQGETI